LAAIDRIFTTNDPEVVRPKPTQKGLQHKHAIILVVKVQKGYFTTSAKERLFLWQLQTGFFTTNKPEVVRPKPSQKELQPKHAIIHVEKVIFTTSAKETLFILQLRKGFFTTNDSEVVWPKLIQNEL
jgi:hypothetical protein